MTRLAKVLALARSYDRTERGRLVHVQGYPAPRKGKSDLAQRFEERERPRDASAYQHYEITGHVVDLYDHLDPDIRDKLLHETDKLKHDEAENIIHQLIAYKKKIGWVKPEPAPGTTPTPWPGKAA